jgi:hypothetical protein
MGNEKTIPLFSRGTWESGEIVSRIGQGEIGGKGSGLWQMSQDLLGAMDHEEHPAFEVTIPRMVVLTTGMFEAFMDLNDLWEIALSDASDARIAQAFQRATLPPEYLGDLRDFISQVNTPLAVRSSSLMEDMLNHPFAGVYSTKMIPNNSVNADTRFQRLIDAVRFVYATTFYKSAKDYFRGTGQVHRDERMAVVVQEVVGNRYGDNFYPETSGVARTFNYYPSGGSLTTDGVVNLALGLGRQIVDGGLSWGYCPTSPTSPPPFNDLGDRIRNTQNRFWAVNMGTPPPPDPMGETEFLQKLELEVAENDGVLNHMVSSYDPASDRLRLGLSGGGPRVLDFGPMLLAETLPLNDLVAQLLPLAERVAGCPVELEFAMDRTADGRHRFCLLQMRAMMVPMGESKVSLLELNEPGVVLASEQALGHGVKNDISDIIYIKPDSFDLGQTPAIALEVEKLNNSLLAAGRPYMLIGFGRWGSADSWLGVPVQWGQISGARVIVESSFRDLNPDPSQGTHFFHNLISFQVSYLTVRGRGSSRIDWDWLERQPTEQETKYLRHVRPKEPLAVRLDGVAGLGIVRAGGSS